MFGYYGAFDIPFTTQGRAVPSENVEPILFNKYFVGTHALGVTKVLFTLGFKQWLAKISTNDVKYTKLLPSDNYLYRPHKAETFLLRYEQNQLLTTYTNEQSPHDREIYLKKIIGGDINFKKFKKLKKETQNQSSKGNTHIKFEDTDDLSIITSFI